MTDGQKTNSELLEENNRLKKELEEKDAFIQSLPTKGIHFETGIKNFDLLLRSTNVGLYDWNLLTNELAISERWAEIVGYTIEELSPLSIETWNKLVHPDDLVKANFVFEKHLMGELEFYESESRMLHKDGKWIWIQSRGKVIEFDINGNPARMIGIHLDITARKNAEAELNEKNHLLLDTQKSAKIGNWSHDLLSEELKWSDEFFRIIGLEPRKPTFELALSIIVDEDIPILEKAIEASANGEKEQQQIIRITRPDGDIRYIHNKWISQYDSDGKEIKRVGTHQDITELKVAEEELRIAKNKAEKANQLKTEFLAQMSHEIRTPINTMLSFIDLIKDEFGDYFGASTNQYFDPIHSAGSRIVRTIDLLLNMSELQTGIYEPVYRSVNLFDEILRKLFAEFKLIARNKGLELSLNADDKSELLKLDAYSIEQIFNNLISNAIKYTSDGKVDIHLYKNKNYDVCVDIKDTGVGISQDFIDHIFDPFRQEEQGYTRMHEGNGLGLALVSEYCKINNVDVKVESTKGKGSVFTVLFNSASKN